MFTVSRRRVGGGRAGRESRRRRREARRDRARLWYEKFAGLQILEGRDIEAVRRDTADFLLLFLSLLFLTEGCCVQP